LFCKKMGVDTVRPRSINDETTNLLPDGTIKYEEGTF